MVTDASGGYLFQNLTPGDYAVEFILPPNYLFSPRDSGADDAADSDADTATGRTVVTNLISNEVDLTWDAGIYRLASLGDYVWRDLDADGVQDTAETGMPGVGVTLYNSAGALVATTTTDANGLYLFDNLVPGDYAVNFTLPTNYTFSPQDQATDDAADSDANATTGRTILTSLISGEDDPTWDTGMLLLAAIGDTVWDDTNYNGVQDSGESGVSGVRVRLNNASGSLIATATTDSSGHYEFIRLMAGDYRLEFTLPDGYAFTRQDTGADNEDSDADPTTGRTVTTRPDWGETDLTLDAGIVRLGWLGDYVWLDTDADGEQDADEVGIPNVTLILTAADGTQETTVTDANGFYLFEQLLPGDYTVTVALDTLPPGLVATYDLDGNLDSIATVALGAGQHIDVVDFGYTPQPTIGTGTEAWQAPAACQRACVDWLLYHTNQTGDWEIFRLDDSDDRAVASPNLSQGEDAEDMAPSRSPNGDWIVFTSNRDGNWEIYLSPTNGDGSRIQRLTNNTIAHDTDPVWGPNNYVVFESTRSGNWDLYLLDMTTGQTRQLTDSAANDINPYWSPDGAKLVFQSDRSGQWQIYELSLATLSVTRLSDGLGIDLDPQYTNAGDRIAFRSYRGERDSVIYVMNSDGSGVQPISDLEGDATNQSWSPDDSLIAYQSDLDGDLDIYVYSMESGQTRRLTDNDIPDYAPTWQCSTMQVIFTSDVTGNPEIFSVDALPITAPAMQVDGDAERLTFNEADDIYPEGAPVEENASREGQLPDLDSGLGEQVTFLEPDTSSTDADVSLERGESWEPVNSCPVACVSWSLYQTNQTGNWEIFRLDDQATNISQSEGDDLEPSRSPNAEWVAYTSERDGNREIHLAAADGSRQQRVTFDAAVDGDPVWSPNSQFIVYESNRDGNWNLYLLDISTGIERRLTDDPADEMNAAWSSAGGSLVFQSNRDGLWQIYRLDLGSGITSRLTRLPNNAYDPLYAFGGSMIVFRVQQEGKSVLYLMQEDGSDLRPISDPHGNASNQSWYYDDTLIAYQSDLDGDTEIYIYDVTTGETRRLTDNEIPDYAPSWQCGDPIVLFTSDLTGDANIYQAPAVPIYAPPIDLTSGAGQLTDSAADERFPVGTPSEENASREAE
jgi:Tol biopolymer transport system component/protocatechuate 3,4-dioxygenase beta subunit